MAVRKQLDLDDAPDTLVFRKLVAILKADKTMRRVFGPERPAAIRSWEGEPHDKAPLSIDQAPCVRLTPTGGPQHFWNPSSMRGELVIDLEVCVKGICVDDVRNLWYAMFRAFYPQDTTAAQTIRSTLQTLGARTGLVIFTKPIANPQPDGTYQLASGQIQIECNFNAGQ